MQWADLKKQRFLPASPGMSTSQNWLSSCRSKQTSSRVRCRSASLAATTRARCSDNRRNKTRYGTPRRSRRCRGATRRHSSRSVRRWARLHAVDHDRSFQIAINEPRDLPGNQGWKSAGNWRPSLTLVKFSVFSSHHPFQYALLVPLPMHVALNLRNISDISSCFSADKKHVRVRIVRTVDIARVKTLLALRVDDADLASELLAQVNSGEHCPRCGKDGYPWCPGVTDSFVRDVFLHGHVPQLPFGCPPVDDVAICEFLFAEFRRQ